MFRTRSFALRLALGYALLTTLTVAVVLVAGRFIVEHQVLHGLDLLNDAEFVELVDRFPTPPVVPLDERTLEILREHTAIDSSMYLFQVLAPDGAVLFRSSNLGPGVLPQPEARRTHYSTTATPAGPIRLGNYTSGAVTIQVASPLEQTNEMLAQQTWALLALGVVVALLSIGLGYAFSRLVLRPVRAIEQTAARISAENLSERIPVPDARDELAELARLLNRMFARLEGAFTQVRRFTAEASHELKTPLALARLHAEKLARAPLAEDQAQQLQALLAELQRLQQIIDDLLLLSRTDAGEMPLARQEQNTAAFIAGFAEDAQALAEDRGLRFALAANDTGIGHFDSAWLRRVLLNLLSNALKFSPAGGALTLRSDHAAGTWRVLLEDEGPGVPPADLARIFDRFVQLGGRPSGGGEGAGLGLAIARSIVALHGGRIWAENRTDRPGLRVTLELPARA
ncbi:MAG TPA: ATP-binding protein [Opitutaceae bacterium]|nr:ATP-binding protein [Opitutaceae bacterium]